PCLPCFFYPPYPSALYTLSLHDALPIWYRSGRGLPLGDRVAVRDPGSEASRDRRSPRARPSSPVWASPVAPTDRPANRAHGRKSDRKSTRLNSSHVAISYAVFCLKKKK